MTEIGENGDQLDISRDVSTAEAEAEIDLAATHAELVRIEAELRRATDAHNVLLREPGLSPLPGGTPG